MDRLPAFVRVLLKTASAAGVILWVVNVKPRVHVFRWDRCPDGGNALVQAVAHAVVFGTVLGKAPSSHGAVRAEA